MTVVAPGKLALLGEYAVVEGRPALVMAINRHVRLSPGPSSESALVARAREAAAKWLEITLARREYRADSGALQRGGKKLGLGGSAAVTVAAVASVFHDAGREIEDREVRAEMWAVAHRVHNDFQGVEGSGLDIAAALFGGWLVMYRPSPGAAPRFEPYSAPRGLRWVFLWTGTSAHTASLLAAVGRFKRADPVGYRRIIDSMGETAAGLLDYGATPPADEAPVALIDGVRRYGALMGELGRCCGVSIVDRRTQACLDWAREAGGAAKPSGAGGGDVVLAVFPESAEVGGFLQTARDAGMVPLELEADDRGVHVAPFLNHPPHPGFGKRFGHNCGVTFTKSMLDVALLRLRSIWLVSLHLHPPHSPRSTDAVED